MAQAVHMMQPCSSGVALVNAHLLHVVAVGRNQGTTACEPVGTVENLSLLLGADRDDALPSALVRYGQSCTIGTFALRTSVPFMV